MKRHLLYLAIPLLGACSAGTKCPPARDPAPVVGRVIVPSQLTGWKAYEGITLVNSDGTEVLRWVTSSIATSRHGDPMLVVTFASPDGGTRQASSVDFAQDASSTGNLSGEGIPPRLRLGSEAPVWLSGNATAKIDGGPILAAGTYQPPAAPLFKPLDGDMHLRSGVRYFRIEPGQEYGGRNVTDWTDVTVSRKHRWSGTETDLATGQCRTHRGHWREAGGAWKWEYLSTTEGVEEIYANVRGSGHSYIPNGAGGMVP